MSDLVFPALPGLRPDVTRAPRYLPRCTRRCRGKEVRVSWRSSPKIRFGLRFDIARTGTMAPSPFGAISEMAVLLKFLDDHKGSLDSFLYPDPYTTSNVRVRLVEDSLRMVQIVSGVWAVESLELESVL